MNLKKLIGLTPEEAKALLQKEGKIKLVRSSVIDGQSQPGTADARPDRINVSVTNGKIDKVIGIG